MHRIQALLEMEGPGGMGTLTLSDIKKGPTHRAPRIILGGPEKVGKSTFAAGMDSPIFLPIAKEEGIDDLDVASFPVANSHQDVIDCIELLIKEDHKYKSFALDSCSALDPIITANAITREGVESQAKLGGGYGRQYDTPCLMWEEIQGGLDYLRNKKNMVICLIGHVKVKKFDDPLHEGYDRYQWDLPQPVYAQLARWADCMLFANRKVILRKDEGAKKARGISGGSPVLYTQPAPGYPAGGRGLYGHLPPEIDLNWSEFTRAVAEAEKARQF